MPSDAPARTIIRVTQLSEMIVGCPAKVPHLLANRPRPQHWTAARGTALHAAMAHLMSERICGRKVPWSTLLAAYDDAWQTERETVEDWTFDGGTVTPDEVQRRGAALLLALAEATRHIEPWLVEQTWSYPIPGTTYTLQGTLDCPSYDNGAIVINDWKTALKPWSAYKRAHQWQHIGYRLLWEHNGPRIPVRAFRWWVADDETGEVECIEHPYPADVVAQAEDAVARAVRLLDADYLPTANDPYACKFCDWRDQGGC